MEKTIKQKYRLYAMLQDLRGERGLYMVAKNGDRIMSAVSLAVPSPFLDIDPGFTDDGVYEVGLAQSKMGENYVPVISYHALAGEARIVVFGLTDSKLSAELVSLIPGNTVPILYQLPQFFLMSLGEVLFSVSGLEFSYTQAAPSMKSVLQAFWLLTTAFGNSIDMIISGTHLISDPAWEFFLFALLMALVMLIFAYIAYRYKYVETKEEEANADVSDDENKT